MNRVTPLTELSHMNMHRKREAFAHKHTQCHLSSFSIALHPRPMNTSNMHEMDDSRSLASASPSYTVFPLPNPPALSDIRAYRDLRLAALHTDPSYFSSTYEREVAFPDETWRERLTGSGKATVVAQSSRPDCREPLRAGSQRQNEGRRMGWTGWWVA